MHLILSSSVADKYVKAIISTLPGLNIIKFPMQKKGYYSISSHPDIFLFQAEKNLFFAEKSLSVSFTGQMINAGATLFRSESSIGCEYPSTAGLNAVRIGTKILHNSRISDTSIKTYARRWDLEIVDVRQGYTRCCCVSVSEKGIITPDRGICNIAKSVGFDVLLIQKGNVVLPGQEYGFIGGASGQMRDGSIFFLGDITQHPEFDKIDGFFRKHGNKYTFLRGLDLLDAGALFFLD